MKKVLASVLALVMLLMCIPLGAVSVSVSAAEYEYAMFPMEYLTVTQGVNESFSHPGRKAIDIAGKDSGIDPVYAPFTGVIKRIYQGWVVWLESSNPVVYADGTVDYMTIMVMHDNDTSNLYVGQVIKQGEHFFDEGTTGYATGNHIHLECGKGKYQNGGWYENSYGDWTIYNSINPYDALYISESTIVKNGYGYNWRKVPSNSGSSSELISQEYNSHCTIATTSKTYIKSLPCSKETDPDSVDVEIANKGTEYEAIALVKNKAGNLWYKVKTKSGETGYMYAGDTTFVKQRLDDVGVKSPVSPTNIKKGNSFTIGGTIYSTYQTITRVQAWVRSTDGTVDYLYGHEWVNVASYSLANSKVDREVKFNNLPVGTYKYQVRIRVDSYYATDGKTVATVYDDEFYLNACESVFTVTDSSCSHYFYEYTVEPTCYGGGYTDYECAYCGYTYTDNYVDPLGCDYEVYVWDPSCWDQGFTEYWCWRCGGCYSDDYIDPLGCDYEVLNVYAPTCTEEGFTEYWCWRCGGFDYGDYTDPLGCDYEVVYVREPSCSESGYTEYECSRCGDYGIEYIDPVGHSYETLVHQPTCTKQGYTEYCCWWCYDYYKGDYVPAKGHSYGIEDFVNATCGADGLMTYTCIACGDSYTESIPATGNHTYDNNCDCWCNVCNTYRMTDPHPYVGEITDPGNCGFHGYWTYTCTECGETYRDLIPATEDHVYDDDYDAYCNVCGKERGVPEKPPVTPDLPADAPAFVVESVTACEGEEITIAIRTQRNSGIVSLRLEVAYDADVLELISLEEGDFANVVLSPTTRNPFIANWTDAINPNNTTDGVVVLATFRVKEGAPLGKTEITLTYDPEDVYDQNFDNVGFRVENGYVEVVDYVVGDVNEDGRINNKDLGLLQQYLAGFEVSVNQRAADVNADSRVNNKDLGLLQQYLAGFEVELG